MVVTFFVSEYDRFHGGQKSLMQLLRRLPDAGVKARVIFPGEGRCSRAYRENGIEVLIMEGPKSVRQFGQALQERSILVQVYELFFQIIPYSFRILREMNRHNSRILHANTTRSLVLSFWMPWLTGKKSYGMSGESFLPFEKSL